MFRTEEINSMLGTIVNSAAIIVCGLLGTLIGNRLTEKYKVIIMQGLGVSVLFVGLSTAIPKMVLPDSNPILFIISLVIGGIVGEMIGIDNFLTKVGNLLQAKFSKGDDSFSKGFIDTTIIFCVGTMAILGAIQSGVAGDHQILYVKSVLDGTVSLIVASTAGIGVIFSAVCVFIYQGLLTLLSGFFAPYLTEDMLREMSVIGGILVTCIGLDLLEIKKMKIANFLPAIIIPVVYYLILGLLKQ